MKGRRKRAVVLCSGMAALLIVFSVTGCGSSTDPYRYAIKRTPDVEVATPAAKSDKKDTSKQARANKSAAPLAAESSAKSKSPPVVEPASDDSDALAASVASAAEATATPLSAAASNETAASGATSVSDTMSPPATPLSEDERARKSVENLIKIGEAFQAYVAEKEYFPARAVLDRSKSKLLSWRVVLLPYLGYQELYDQFRLNEPWNSRHNRTLLSKIPAVYQSPERFDERTNYLVPVSSITPFGQPTSVYLDRVQDGAQNTIFLLEVDDALAVPWTEPRDYDLETNDLTRDLGALRGDSFFVIWGSGDVGRIMTSTNKRSLKAAYTFDGGEDFAAGRIDRPLFPPSSMNPSAGGTATSSAESAPGGPGATAVAGAPLVGGADLVSLAVKYTQNSGEAAESGSERDARLWFYASAVVSPSGNSWAEKYQWVPALKRPSAGIRFGVGLQYSGPRRTQLEQQQAKRIGSGTRSSNSVWNTATKDIGKSLIETLSAHVEQSGAAAFAPVEEDVRPGRRPTRPAALSRRSTLLLDSAHGEPLAPGVYFLALADELVLKQFARHEGIDVLVLVDWKDLGHKQSVRFELIDPVRDTTLMTVPWFDSNDVADALADPLKSNPFPERLRLLSEYLEQQLTPQPLPDQIQPRHVEGRMTALAASKPENPLATLAELRYYRMRGLADDTQLLLAYQSLLGQAEGTVLILGNAEQREHLLKPWLPPPPVAAARTLRTTAVDDD